VLQLRRWRNTYCRRQNGFPSCGLLQCGCSAVAVCYTHTIACNMAALHEGAQFLDLVQKSPKVSSTLISHGQFSSELTVENKQCHGSGSYQMWHVFVTMSRMML